VWHAEPAVHRRSVPAKVLDTTNGDCWVKLAGGDKSLGKRCEYGPPMDGGFRRATRVRVDGLEGGNCLEEAPAPNRGVSSGGDRVIESHGFSKEQVRKPDRGRSAGSEHLVGMGANR